ncbi:hypothetical protein Droror1_Dr00007259 [Drosera rotundifolia]
MLLPTPRHLLHRLSHTSTTFIDQLLSTFLTSPHLRLLPSHALIIVSGNSNNPFIASKLISLYTANNNPDASTKIFYSVSLKDPFLWSSMIKTHFSNGDYSNAIRVYREMRESGMRLNYFGIPIIVSACGEVGDVREGERVHGLVRKLGFMAANAALVYMYSKWGRVGDARKVFDEVRVRDVVVWTAIVVGYVRNGEAGMGLECVREMCRQCERPNHRTLEAGMIACGNLMGLREGMCLHGFGIKEGFDGYSEVQSGILSLYSKCGAAENAWLVFCEMDHKDLVCWTAVIAAYAKGGHVNECLLLFSSMLVAGLYPDGIAISCVASCFDGNAREGKAFHGFLTRRKCILDQVAVNGLISMYFRFQEPFNVEKLFHGGHNGNAESWNLMACGYGKGGLALKCIYFFRKMQHQGIQCDLSSIVSAIASCSQVSACHFGRSLHCYAIKILVDGNLSVSNSLIDMYGKCGKLAHARIMFSRIEGDTVTWNSMVSAYAHQGNWADALELFDRMVKEGLVPNSATLVTVLSACSHLASFEKTERIHNYIQKCGIEMTTPLATALLYAYGKCGQVIKSREIFNAMMVKDVVSWNVMIFCYGMHGDAISALQVFKQMEESCVRPNGLTFLAVLSACSHGGLAKEGRRLFAKMHDYSVTQTVKHYACMVDLLGKSGSLNEAEDMMMSMPFPPDGGIWGSLLTACKIHNNVDVGIRVAIRATESDPANDGYHIILSNMFDSIGNWEEAEKVREVMKQRGVRKCVGWSSL